MTEQEAYAYEVRLRRIWEVEEEMPMSSRLRGGIFTTHIYINQSLELGISSDQISFVRRNSGRIPTGVLWCEIKDGSIKIPLETVEGTAEELRQFRDHWLPFFRRGCWLSGAPLEASAHEKAEWIQGFSREELEAWNLKM